MKIKYIQTVFILSIIFSGTKAQVSITGPICPVAGGTNGVLYAISGPVQISDNITWTVRGGIIAGTGSNSISGTISSIGMQIRVVWKAGAQGAGAGIELKNNRLGSFTLPVNVITIDGRVFTNNRVVTPLSAVRLTGGGLSDISCSPVYFFWWESSDNSYGPFTAIDNSNIQNLDIPRVTNKKYYRRVLCANGDNFYSKTILIDTSSSITGGNY